MFAAACLISVWQEAIPYLFLALYPLACSLVRHCHSLFSENGIRAGRTPTL
jgi:hypothetical protein